MAEEKKAPKVGRDGIDSWTSNGHGIVVIKKPDKKITNEEFREYVNGGKKKK